MGLGSGLLLLSSLASAQFARTPRPNEQIRLGQDAAAKIRKSEKVLPASDIRVKTLRSVASRILSTIHGKEPWQYTFDVIDSKTVNAFALPGGATFFYTGLLSKLKSEDELAGVLAHELTHVRKEHWAKMYRDEVNKSAWLNVGAMILRTNDTINKAVGMLSNLDSLKYSRGDETQADVGGFDLMVAAGYNPQGMVDLFNMLQKEGGGSPMELLSDHPSDQRRVNNIKDRMKKANRSFPEQTPLKWSDKKVSTTLTSPSGDDLSG